MKPQSICDCVCGRFSSCVFLKYLALINKADTCDLLFKEEKRLFLIKINKTLSGAGCVNEQQNEPNI